MGRMTGEKANVGLALHQLPGQLLADEDLEAEHWYDGAPAWPEEGKGGPRGTKVQWTEVAELALSSASRMYEKRVNGSSGDVMKRALGKEKTVGDRIAAVTLLVQESPVHRLDELRTLLSFAEKKGRRERVPAIEAMKDLFINDLLPGDRRLVLFSDREFSCSKGAISKRHVLYGLFENELKMVYRSFLHVLEDSGKDTLAFFKQKMVKVIAELLIAKPENEKELLSMLVNKLGDPDRKVSSTASYNLLQLIQKYHPQMRLIVVREVEQLLTRPNVSRKAQYYAVSFLNQIRFGENDVELARKFIRIYMDLFTTCLEEEKNEKVSNPRATDKAKSKRLRKRGRTKKVDMKLKRGAEAKETRLMGALLIGVNRAFPYTKPEEDDSLYQRYYDALFHVSHAKTLGSATHAMAFLFQMARSNSTQSDRFYRALYSRIHDSAEAGEATQAAFLNLLYKAIRSDTNTKRTKAYMKRLLQAGMLGSPGFAGACIMVLSETFSGKELGVLTSFISMTERDDEDEHFSDVEDKSSTGSSKGDSDSATTDDEALKSDRSPMEQTTRKGGHMPLGGADSRQTQTGEISVRSARATTSSTYDPGKRDPQYAGAEKSSLWESVALCCHYQPSVATFAHTIFKDLKNVKYDGDPLKDFSGIAFLDRFSYKKPKNRVAKSLYGKRSARYRDDPVANSLQFQELVKAGNIQEDDRFFAKYFAAHPEKVQKPGDGDRLKLQRDQDDTDIDSEEEAFEQAMQVEMRRMGADTGFFSRGIKDFMGDIDGEDEDELRAFEKAFQTEMLKSDDEEEIAGDGGAPPSEVALLSDGDDASDSEENGRETEQQEDPAPFAGVFAAAEDYADAIEKDQTGQPLGGPAPIPAVSEKKRTQDHKRHGKTRRPSKKRRIKG